MLLFRCLDITDVANVQIKNQNKSNSVPDFANNLQNTAFGAVSRKVENVQYSVRNLKFF
jgi:hypothetical protein